MWGVRHEELQEHPAIDQLVSIASQALARPERAEMLKHFVRSATTDRRQRSGRLSLKDGRHLPFNFQLIDAPWNARDLATLIAGYEAALPQGGWPNWVLGNHEIGRAHV